jgi:urease accessory protein
MRRAARVEKAGQWPADEAKGRVTLAFDDRHRRRIKLTTDGGDEFLLDLPEARVLQDGDGLELSDGSWLAVRAAPEPLLQITAHGAEQLARLAWHIGNRHLVAQIAADCIFIREDHVIAEMLRGLGAHVRRVMAPFSPEGGAYDTHGQHEHDHDHDHG